MVWLGPRRMPAGILGGMSEPRLAKDERVLGCLLGGALGDAWGGPTEGTEGPLRFEVPARPVLSDDTQLTLATCESILELRCVSPEGIASRFRDWFVSRRLTGLGASTLKAMRDLAAGTHWALAGSHGEFSAGSGAAMRIAPLAFCLDPKRDADRIVLRDVCRITHHHDEAYMGALAVTHVLRAIGTEELSEGGGFLEVAAVSLPDCAVRDRINELRNLPNHSMESAARFGTSGYVVDAVPLALCCAESIVREPLSDVLSRTIALGGDTDTVASIAGQLAGATVGVSGLPLEAISTIEGAEYLLKLARQFGAFVSQASLL